MWWRDSSINGAVGNAKYSSFPSFLDPLWPRLVAPDRILSMGLLKLNIYAKHYVKLNCLKWNCFWHWNRIYVKLNFWNRTVLIFHHHHHDHDHVLPLAPISVTLSCHSSQSFITSGWSSERHPQRVAVCRFELVTLLLLGHVRGFIGKRHQLCSACLVGLTLIVFVMGGRCPYR